MALVLALQQGRSFYANDTQVKLSKINNPQSIRLTIVGTAMDRSFEVTDRERVEVLPDVFVQLGSGSSLTMAKVVLEAPKAVKLWRDSLYLKQKEEDAGV